MMKNNLTTSDNFTVMMISFEEEVLRGYLDPVGIPTIGIGHVIRKDEHYKVGQSITREESRRLFKKDTAWAIDVVNNRVKVSINQNQFDALVSLVFNIGESGFLRSSVLRELNQGHFQRAAEAFALWNKSQGKVLRGLVRRRKAETKLFLTPIVTEKAINNVATTDVAKIMTHSLVDTSETQAAIEGQSSANVGFVEKTVIKTVEPPPPDGSTATATRLTIAGLTLPPVLAALVRTIQDAVANGYVDAKTIGDGVISFLTSNYKYVFLGIGILIAFLTVKKLFKQITLWLEMYFAASAKYNDVKVKKG